jgi:hypothetical protein
MKFFIRTIENGKRLPVEKVDEKRKAAKDKILAAGLQYVEVEAVLGSLDALAQRIEERVYIIEGVAGVQYV